MPSWYTPYTMMDEPAQATTRTRLLDAARTLFDQLGLSGLSMRRVAEAVEVTPMAIYKHFEDKEALVDALMLDGMAEWESRVVAIDAQQPVAWLNAFAEAFLAFALDEPRRYEAAFMLPSRHARRYPDDFAARRSPVINLVTAKIERAQQLGLFVRVPAAEMALTLAALGQGLVSIYQAGRFAGEAQFREAYRRTICRCIASFRTSDGVSA